MAANPVYHDIEKLLNAGGYLGSATLRLPAPEDTLFNSAAQKRASHAWLYRDFEFSVPFLLNRDTRTYV